MLRKKGKSTLELVRSGADRMEGEVPPDTPKQDQSRAERNPKPNETKKWKKGAAQKKRSGKEHLSTRSLLRSRGFLGGVSIALALFLAFGVTPLYERMVSEGVTVVVFREAVQIGERVTADMVQEKEMLPRDLPDQYFDSVGDVLGLYVTCGAVEGDIATPSRLSAVDTGSGAELNELPDGMSAISISLPQLSQSVSSKLRGGDVVTLYYVASDGGLTAAAPPELRYVEVLSVSDAEALDANAGTDGERGVIATVTLACYPEQAALLAGLDAQANIYAAFVVRNDEEKKTALLTAQSEYFASQREENGAAGLETEDLPGTEEREE